MDKLYIATINAINNIKEKNQMTEDTANKLKDKIKLIHITTKNKEEFEGLLSVYLGKIIANKTIKKGTLDTITRETKNELLKEYETYFNNLTDLQRLGIEQLQYIYKQT